VTININVATEVTHDYRASFLFTPCLAAINIFLILPFLAASLFNSVLSSSSPLSSLILASFCPIHDFRRSGRAVCSGEFVPYDEDYKTGQAFSQGELCKPFFSFLIAHFSPLRIPLTFSQPSSYLLISPRTSNIFALSPIHSPRPSLIIHIQNPLSHILFQGRSCCELGISQVLSVKSRAGSQRQITNSDDHYHHDILDDS
jgi:hypothetical protein